jgi:hypothetical protein
LDSVKWGLTRNRAATYAVSVETSICTLSDRLPYAS